MTALFILLGLSLASIVFGYALGRAHAAKPTAPAATPTDESIVEESAATTTRNTQSITSTTP